MNPQIILLVLATALSLGCSQRLRRGVLATPAAVAPVVAAAPLAAVAAPSPPFVYSSAAYAVPSNPIVARASRVVGQPGFIARYVAAPVAPLAPVAPVVTPSKYVATAPANYVVNSIAAPYAVLP